MNIQAKNPEKKSINRSIYGLLMLVFVVFCMIFIFIQLQNNGIERLEKIAYNYHLSTSEKSQGILSSIAEMNLWFKNAYIIKEEITAHKTDQDVVITPFNEGVSPRDKMSSFDYEVNKYVHEIELLQHEFKDDEFSNLSAQLFKSYIQAIEDLRNINPDNIRNYKNIDNFSSPLRTVAHQLSRLHRLEYQEKRRRIDEAIKNNQNELVVLIVALMISAAIGAVKLLQHLNLTLLELITVNKEKEFNQARFESMFESISDAVIVVDTNRNISLVNSSVEKLFGYHEDELIGNKTSMIYANPEDFSSTGKEKYNVDAQGEYLAYEIKYRRKDGTYFWGETLGSKIVSADGDVFGFVGIIRDITERKSTSQALQRFKDTLDQTLDCVFMFDADKLVFSYVNEGALQQIGYSFNELQTMHPYDIKPEVSEQQFDELIAPLISGEKESLSFETVHQHKSGKKISVEIFLQYIVTENESAHFVAVVRDITDRKKAEEEINKLNISLENRVIERTKKLESTLFLLTDENEQRKKAENKYREAKEQAEKASAAKSDFLSRMSHELRTPMNAILGFGQLLELGSENFNESQKANIQEILEAGNHLLELINDVLDLTEIEAGKFDISMGKVELKDVVSQCLSLMEPLAKKRQIKQIDNISEKGYVLHADFTRLKQVLLNVLSNAVKYNREEGSITLDGEVIDEQYLRISITDTGEGVKEEDMSKLFTSFERLNPTVNVEGSGIGLNITKHIVELMGGKVGVTSTLGQGSTFWFELKLS